MKKMATVFLILGILFVGISVFMFTRKKPLEDYIAVTEKERTETPEPVFTSN